MLPKVIQNKDRGEQKYYIYMFAREGRCVQCQTHGDDNKEKIYGIWNKIADCSTIHAENGYKTII